eukprot:6594009-Pyramimonas_sp.AAC.1
MRPQHASKEGPKRQTSLTCPRCLKDLGVLAFSASRRCKTAQMAPKTTPKRPKRPPRGPKTA